MNRGAAARHVQDVARWRDALRLALIGEAIFAIPFLVEYLYLGARWSTAAVLTTIAVALAGLRALHLGAHRLAAHAIVVAVFVAPALSRIEMGGFLEVGTAWLVLVPIIAALVLRPIAALVWFAVVCTTVLLLLVQSFFGPPLPNLVPDSMRAVHTGLNSAGILATTGLIALLHIKTRDRELAAIDASQRSMQKEIRERQRAEQVSREANLAKDRFMATISHEIRTPMNGVLAMTELLQRAKISPLEREYAQTAHRSAQALLTLIDDLLDFSKLEAGHVQLERARIDLHSLLEDVCDVVAVKAHAKGLALLLDIELDTPRHVVADPARIRQILVNLLGNAVKFTDQGHVRLRARRLPDDRLSLAVEDTGIGISAEALPTLFTPFAQADASITRRFGGTGLGLSVARGFAEALGGALHVRSRPSEGSTFEVLLPLTDDDGPSGPAPLEGRRALVLDPHDEERGSLRRTLAALGASVLDAADPRTAPDAKVDVVFVDRALVPQTSEQFLGTPIFALTTWTSSEEEPASRAQAYLRRPVRRARLVDAAMNPSSEAASEADEQSRTLDMTGRVLVVDDNPVNQLVARRLLERLGCEVDVAADGRQACDRARETSYEAILMDCQMPVMDGYEASRRIRENLGPACPPILGLSAAATPRDREEALAAGMDGYLVKPITLPALQDNLLGLLAGSQRNKTSAR